VLKLDLTVFAPGLCAPWRGEGSYSSLPAPHVPALHHLLSRADCGAQPALAFEDALARALGIEAENLPWGALGLWGETGERPAGLVLRIDPVHLRLGMTEAIVTAGAALPLSLAEAQELARALEAHFIERGWSIVVAAPQRWYVHVPESSELVTTPLGQALGHDAGLFKPQGRDARRWLADINEAQMLLFAHPVNAAREARGVPTVNSLWPWGAGSVAVLDLLPPPLRGRAGERGGQYAPQAPCCNASPPLPQPASPPSLRSPRKGRGEPVPITVVYADNPLARGLAHALGLPVRDLPETFDECADLSATALIVLDDLVLPWQDGDYDDWHATLEGLDARWFTPLRRALAQGSLSALQIDTDTARFVCKPAQRWRFWRTVKPLESLCSAARV
jgi:hypothetical protein